MISKNSISHILSNSYDRILFGKDILKHVFSGFQMFETALQSEIEPTTVESKTINKVLIYGKIFLSDETEITCYEIHLQPSVHIEQSKVSIQQYVRKLLISGHGALINFVSSVNKDIWRFTLVAKDNQYIEGKVKEVATHAKRYTYLVETGANKHNRTLAERLETLSTTKEQNLQSLINAFSVETLSKAFFDEYKAHYNKFIQYLNGSNFFTSVFKTNDKTVRDFTKKLLGRLVFLYFVQRKGWLGASNNKYKDGNQDFLMNLFLQSGCNDSFYPVWLKTLFFDTLNNPAKNGDFKMPDGNLVKIPFLNGGLFDKDDIDNFDFTIPSELFHNDTHSELPIKRGFFNFLNSFNFTIYEDSPDDHTVAVDPEMLGHIFENLLEDNKDKGAYYTPKQIVHYMCQESLNQYLFTNLFPNNEDVGEHVKGAIELLVKDKQPSAIAIKYIDKINELLDNVKICDPAIGSGAFPVGLLHEIFSLKEILADFAGIELNRAEIKENIIQNSIYGVDIEKGAVDIARLRFWLSLVVDEDSPKPLPNLDYKIVEGNSLISKFEDEVLTIDWSSDTAKVGVFAQEYAVERIRLLTEISNKQKEYFHSEKIDKKTLTLEIRNLKIDLLITQLRLMIKSKGIDNVQSNAKGAALKQQTELMLQTQGWKNAIKKLENIKKQPNAKLQFFDWKLDFPEIMNENIVKSGNSPEIYVLNKQIEALNKQIEAVNAAIENNSSTKLIKIKLLTTENQIKTVEAELIRIEKQIENIIGTISFIDKNIVGELNNVDHQISGINNKIETINQRIAKANEVLLPKSSVSLGFDIVIGNPPYVDNRELDEAIKKNKEFYFTNLKSERANLYIFFIEKGFNVLKNKGILSFINPNYFLSTDSGFGIRKMVIENTLISFIVDLSYVKIFEAATYPVIWLFQKTKPNNNLIRINRCKDLSEIKNSTFQIENDFIKKDLKFRIPTDKNFNLITKIENNHKKLKDFCKLLWGTSQTGYGKKKIELNEFIKLNENAKKKYLPILQTSDIKRYIIEWKEEYLPISVFSEKVLSEFKKEKIVIARVTKKLQASYDLEKRCVGKSTVMVDYTFSRQFFLALLNSTLINYWYLSRFESTHMAGGYLRFDIPYLEQIPIPTVSEKAQELFIKLVDKITALKKEGKSTANLEKEIDLMVYKLYELTDEEIAIVEGKK